MKISNLIAAILILFLLVNLQSAAADISLSAHLDKTNISFESSVELSLEVKWQGGIDRYAFEILPIPTTKNLQVMGTASSISTHQEAAVDMTIRTFNYAFKPTQGGIGTIEPIILRYVLMPDSIPGELSSQRFQIMVAEPIPKKESSRLPLFLAIVGFVAVLSTSAIYLIFTKRKEKAAIEPAKAPEEIFLENLAVLKKESQSDRKQFFTRLYRLFILFIEAKYNLPCQGRATSDLLAELENLEISHESKERLADWLTLTGKEKYAPISGEPGDVVRLISEIENFFNRK